MKLFHYRRLPHAVLLDAGGTHLVHRPGGLRYSMRRKTAPEPLEQLCLFAGTLVRATDADAKVEEEGQLT